MEIIIRGTEVDLEGYGFENVGDVFDFFTDRGYIISDLQADGQNISNSSEKEIEEIKPIEKLEIEVKEIAELEVESLEEAENYLPRAISGIEEIVAKFRQGNELKGYTMLSDLLEGLEWLSLLIEKLEDSSEINLNNINEFNIKKFIKEWQEVLQKLFTAMENQDLVLIGDLLEYELLPMLKDYLKLVKKIKTR